MKRFFIFLLLLTTTSCTRQCSSLNRSIQITNKPTTIELYSGGKLIFSDSLVTMINNSKDSDGIYYYNSNGDLVELSGDYVIKIKQ
jgi:hypothetical protein